MFYNSCSCGRRGRIAHEVKNLRCGEKLDSKTACSYAAASAWVCSELAAALSGPPTNRRKWIPFKMALTLVCRAFRDFSNRNHIMACFAQRPNDRPSAAFVGQEVHASGFARNRRVGQ